MTIYPLLSLKKMDSAMLLFELQHITRAMSDEDAEMLMSAAQLATYLHRNQRRFVRDDMPKVPYIEHPLRNTLRLHRWGSTDAEILTIALLHDVVEDCTDELLELGSIKPSGAVLGAGTLGARTINRCMAIDKLTADYGTRVGEGVEALTNPINGSYLDHVVEQSSNRDFALVKASDLHDNAGSLKHQIGGMKPESMRRRIAKYAPAVSFMCTALKEFDDPVARNALTAMRKVRHSLNQLEDQIGSTTTP